MIWKGNERETTQFPRYPSLFTMDLNIIIWTSFDTAYASERYGWAQPFPALWNISFCFVLEFSGIEFIHRVDPADITTLKVVSKWNWKAIWWISPDISRFPESIADISFSILIKIIYWLRLYFYIFINTQNLLAALLEYEVPTTYIGCYLNKAGLMCFPQSPCERMRPTTSSGSFIDPSLNEIV